MMKLPRDKILLFTETMSMLLNAGMPIQNAVSVCSGMENGKKLTDFCLALQSKLDGGKSLSMSIMELSDSFGVFYIEMIRIGETSGSITEVFTRLTSYLKQKKRLNGKISQALFYPVTVLVTAVMVIVVMMVYVFPKMKGIFEVFSAGGSGIEDKIRGVERTFILMSGVISLILALFIVVVVARMVSVRARVLLDSWLLRLPFIGKYFKTLCTSDFCFAMKVLIASGCPAVNAVARSGSVVGNAAYGKALRESGRKISLGDSFSEVFGKEMLFPRYLVTWMKLAERTGNINSVFSQLNDYYLEETESMAEKTVSGLEPVLILITGAIICMLISQFVIPVFRMLGSI